MRKFLKGTALVLAVLMLCGCSQPEVPAAPVFDPNTVQEASAPLEAAEPRKITRSETFRNADGSTEFCVNIDTELSMEPLPVVEAVPRELTAQDAHDLIYAFFPDAKCYERHPGYSSEETNWTKAELEKEMERWRAYDYEDLVEIWGGVDSLPQAMRVNGDDVPFVEYWEESMQYFEELLKKVPEEDMRTPSMWHMFKETEYREEPEEAARMDLSKDRDCVMANVVVGDDHYYYVVASGNPLFGTTNLISLSYNTPDSPANVDWQIFLSENDTLPEPTQEDLDRAREVAQGYLDKFPIGKWALDRVEPSHNDGTIEISCKPAESGLPDGEQVTLNTTAYEMPQMYIRMRPNGQLLNFSVRGSLTEVITHAENAVELPVDTLLDTALEYLKAGETMTYGIDEEALYYEQIWYEEDFTCKVDVTKAVRGYVRINTPAANVCYAPWLTLYGSAAYYGKESGEYVDPKDTAYLPVGEIPLAVVNAIDGSIVPIHTISQ